MFSFSQKIIVSYLILFLIFFGLLFPFVTQSVKALVEKSMDDIAIKVIQKVDHSENLNTLIANLRKQEFSVVFRMSLIDSKGMLLYDSHLERLLGKPIDRTFTQHPEVVEALKKGIGFSEQYSVIFGENYFYLAKAFHFQKKVYVLRMAFPAAQIKAINHRLEVGFFILATLFLFLFALMTFMILRHLTKPIRQIIQTIRPYQEGKTKVMPNIELNVSATEDFNTLANTINLLYKKEQGRIKSITEEKNKKQSVIDALHEGVIAFDKEGKVTSFNLSALRLLNLKQEDVDQKSFTSILEKLEDPIASVIKNLFIQIERTKQFAKKIVQFNQRYLELITAPFYEDIGHLLVIADQTNNYKVVEMGKQFIANASHELKTPITIIQGYAETLHDNPNLSKSQVEEATASIVKNCGRMTQLIKNLLSLAEIEHISSATFEKCDLVKLVQECREMISGLYENLEFHLICKNEPYYVYVIPNLIELAIFNLLENGAKYSKGAPHLTVTLEKKEGSIEMRIEDKGVGIPREELEHIFKQFYSVDKSKSKKLGGVGLGLSIVKTIIEKNDVRINVESEVDKGTTFILIFYRLRPD
jgi:signal transduction histidine kinase